MSMFEPRNEEWEARVRKGFAEQGFMAHLGATLQRVQPGRVGIVARKRDELTQQHRFVHAGVLAALADTAAGFAALTLAAGADDVLTASPQRDDQPASARRHPIVGSRARFRLHPGDDSARPSLIRVPA